jgi:hypothetical protein
MSQHFSAGLLARFLGRILAFAPNERQIALDSLVAAGF